jgi:iron(III) transport system substrate-binding protein
VRSGFVLRSKGARSWGFTALAATALIVAACGKNDNADTQADYATRAADMVAQGKITKACLPNAAPSPAAEYVPIPQASKELIAAASKEGQLVINAGISDSTSITALEAAFELRYPNIKLSVATGNSESLEERFLADHAAGNQQVDVEISTKRKFIERALKDKAIHPLDRTIPGIFNTWPKGSWRWETDYGTTGIPFYRPLGIAYNTDLVKGDMIPKQYKDLANPAFKGHLLGLDPEASSTFASVWKQISKSVDENTMRAIGNNLIKKPLYSDIQVGAQALGAGGGMVIMEMGKNVAETMHASGAPVQGVMPDAVTGPQYGFGVATDAPHPYAAGVFAHWLYSAEGQWSMSCSAFMGSVAYPTHGVKTFVPFEPVSKEEMVKIKQQLGL